jgi:hypothetical protein
MYCIGNASPYLLLFYYFPFSFLSVYLIVHQPILRNFHLAITCLSFKTSLIHVSVDSDGVFQPF